MTEAPLDPHPITPAERRLPPISEVCVVVTALVVCGGIYLAAHLPRQAPLGPAIALLAAAGALVLGNVAMLGRLQGFGWDVFFQVGRWALLGYAVIAGMLEYVFVLDHTPGRLLVVLTLMLVVFAVNIPILLAFSVARYQ